ncbi:MAG: arginase family protein [Planctomycetota bacterium]|nr:arginase family protein [Planctomycetota bacterium]
MPHTTPADYPPEIAPARLAAHVLQTTAVGCRVAILGLPDDTGVRLNAGRPGARAGPAAFRAAFARFGIAQPHGWSWPRIFDAGDVVPAPGDTEAALLETHERVRAATRALLELNVFPIAIGGGHDLTLPFLGTCLDHAAERAAADSPARPPATRGVVNIDAHLDVREQVGSGMAFRGLVERHHVRELCIVGFEPLVNSREHVEWFLAHGGRVHEQVPSGQYQRGQSSCTPAAHEPRAASSTGSSTRSVAPSLRSDVLGVSFDLDALDAAHAPGVSAINPAGLGVREAGELVRELGRDARVHCFDIMELSPPHDDPPGGTPASRTARAAVYLFLSFLRGFAERTPDAATLT